MSTKRSIRFSLSLGLLAGISAAAFAQGEPDTIARIIEEGRDRGQAPLIHQRLTIEVGARVTGSQAMAHGYKWALNRMREIGLTNPHLEYWGTVPMSFDRGKRQSGKMVSPTVRDFIFTTNCWLPGTTGPVRGQAIVMPETMGELNAMKSQLRGAWILMPKEAGMRGPDHKTPTELDKAADAAGIAGRVYKTNGELVWTHGTWMDYTDQTRPKTPLVTIRKSDYEAVMSAIEAGRKPQLEFDLENIMVKQEMPCYNIVGEIPGTEKPDEVVIICGHFDSWNGPGSQGASDNGTGTAATLEAARILMASGAKPKRTIRFILWTGEEQGLLGSRAYVEQHAHEMHKISAVINEDSGQNWQAAIVGLENMMPMLNQAVEPMKNAFPGMEVSAVKSDRFPRSGSDHVPFIMRGVPGFFMRKGGNLSYGHVWHTQNDKASEVPPMNLKQMATNMAVIGYNIACADGLVPRVPIEETSLHIDQVGGYFEKEDHICICGDIIEMGFQIARLGF